MKKIKKIKFLTLVLVLAMVVQFAPKNVFAENNNTDLKESKFFNVIDSNETKEVNGCRRYEVTRDIQANFKVSNEQDLMIILDTSTSMDTGSPVTLISVLAPALQQAVNKFMDYNPNNRVSLVIFGGNGNGIDDARISFDLTSNREVINNKMSNIYGQDEYGYYVPLSEFIWGNTNIEAGVEKGKEILIKAANENSNRNMNVMLVTDGGANVTIGGKPSSADEIVNQTIKAAQGMKSIMPDANYIGLSLLHKDTEYDKKVTEAVFDSFIPKENQIIDTSSTIVQGKLTQYIDKLFNQIQGSGEITITEKFNKDIVDNFTLGTFRKEETNGVKVYNAIEVNGVLVSIEGIDTSTEENKYSQVAPVEGIRAIWDNVNKEIRVTLTNQELKNEVNKIKYQLLPKDDSTYSEGIANIKVDNNSKVDLKYSAGNREYNSSSILEPVEITNLSASLKVDAGQDKEVKANEVIQLGGDPTAKGGDGTYFYTWSVKEGSGVVIPEGEIHKSNPQIDLGKNNVKPESSIVFEVMVTDNHNCIRKEEVRYSIINENTVIPKPEDKPNVKPNAKPENKPNNDGSQSVDKDNSAAEELPQTGQDITPYKYGAIISILGVVLLILDRKRKSY